MEIDFTQDPEIYGEQLFQKHRLEKLKELATNWNTNHNKNLINININNWFELTCELFARQYKPPIEITFPEPYYSLFYEWTLQDPEEEKLKHIVFELYNCNNHIIDYLYYSLSLPMESYTQYKNPEKLKENLIRFNELWIKLDICNKKPIKNYDEFRNMLTSNKLSIFDLIYIVLECENYSITIADINMYMLVDRVKNRVGYVYGN